MKTLTSPDYWDSKYPPGQRPQRIDVADFRQRPFRAIVERIEALGLRGKRILEIGAGGSAVLTCLAERNRSSGAEFHGLDYSEAGCLSLETLAAAAGVSVKTHNSDFFSPPGELASYFDVIYSLGVVEHFDALPEVLGAQARLLTPGGLLLSVVPNLSGLIGSLARRYNKKLFDMHKVHTPASLAEGHTAAGLEPLSSGYLCSTNFGVLSACFESPAAAGWPVYLWLSRFSTAVWYLEHRLFPLPGTRLLSPYICVVARKPGNAKGAG